MDVSLTPEMAKLVKAKVRTGLYRSADEVVREALQLLQERDTEKERRLAELRQKIEVGWEQAERGDLLPAKKIFQDLRERSRQKRRSGA